MSGSSRMRGVVFSSGQTAVSPSEPTEPETPPCVVGRFKAGDLCEVSKEFFPKQLNSFSWDQVGILCWDYSPLWDNELFCFWIIGCCCAVFRGEAALRAEWCYCRIGFNVEAVKSWRSTVLLVFWYSLMSKNQIFNSKSVMRHTLLFSSSFYLLNKSFCAVKMLLTGTNQCAGACKFFVEQM